MTPFHIEDHEDWDESTHPVPHASDSLPAFSERYSVPTATETKGPGCLATIFWQAMNILGALALSVVLGAAGAGFYLLFHDLHDANTQRLEARASK